jgi:hypothetical protein
MRFFVCEDDAADDGVVRFGVTIASGTAALCTGVDGTIRCGLVATTSGSDCTAWHGFVSNAFAAAAAAAAAAAVEGWLPSTPADCATDTGDWLSFSDMGGCV